jgi:hypothetical protein
VAANTDHTDSPGSTCSRSDRAPRLAIVGAGLGGLTWPECFMCTASGPSSSRTAARRSATCSSVRPVPTRGCDRSSPTSCPSIPGSRGRAGHQGRRPYASRDRENDWPGLVLGARGSTLPGGPAQLPGSCPRLPYLSRGLGRLLWHSIRLPSKARAALAGLLSGWTRSSPPCWPPATTRSYLGQ